MLMSVSQYAEHSGMSRRSFYNWESHEGFPERVDGKIDQMSRYRSASNPRTKNARVKTKPAPVSEVQGRVRYEFCGD